MKTLYISGGCFWCIEYYLMHLEGVISTECGYSGGDEKDVNYEKVKAQLTGHRESLKIIYDENIISIKEIIKAYLSYVDPYDKDGQYIDRGHSYTLAIYYEDEPTKDIVNSLIREFEEEHHKKTYISIEPFKFFITAEKEHQKYSKNNPKEFIEELKTSGRNK